MNIRISNSIPIPSTSGKGRPRKWHPVLSDMLVGDSIDVSLNEYFAIARNAKKLRINITSRRLPDNNVRVWRVE